MERKFRKNLDSLEEITSFVQSFAEAHSLGEDTVFALNFVIEEIFTNMVKYQPTAGLEATIELSRERSALRVRLIDHNAGYFDPTAAPAVDTTKPIEERRPGGLGVYLVKKYVDEFTYERAGNDSIITLVKKLKE